MGSDAFLEEFFHAYQHDNQRFYEQGEFNKEFEAKVFVLAAGCELPTTLSFPGMEFFSGYLTISKYGDELHRLTPTTVVDVAFIKDYIYFANVFSAFHEKGYNDSYKCRTSVKPYSLQNIIIQTYR